MRLGLKRWGIYSLLLLVVGIQGCKDDSDECPWIIIPYCIVGAVATAATQAPPSSSARTTPGDTGAPGTPSYLRSEYQVSTGEMSVSWQQASDNTLVYEYRIYRDGNHFQTAPGPGFVDINLDPDRIYCYQVSARDYSGIESQRSIESCTSTAHSSWVAQLPPSGAGLIHPTSLALDLAGNAHIGFFVAESRDVYYATNAFGEWSLTRIDTGAEGAPSLSLDMPGKVHLVYQTSGARSLKYATNASGEWRITTLDNTWVGGKSSIGIDSAGKAHVKGVSSPLASRRG